MKKQEGQGALNCSPEFFFKANIYLLKAGHVSGDTLGQAILALGV